MKTETCLEVQAYLDGELESSRRAAIAALCEQDTAARALRDSLQVVRDTVRQHEPEHRLSDSREFYWSQIQRRIAAAERQAETRPARPLPAWTGLFRWLVPVAGLAAVTLVFTLRDDPRQLLIDGTVLAAAPASATSVEYRSDTDGVTIHWIN